jgi:FMN phosphatase YigB (HAD superfamily)
VIKNVIFDFDGTLAAVTWGFDSIDSLKSGKPDCICNAPMEIYDYIYENNVLQKDSTKSINRLLSGDLIKVAKGCIIC